MLLIKGPMMEKKGKLGSSIQAEVKLFTSPPKDERRTYFGLETLTDKDRKEANEVFSRNSLDRNKAAPRQCLLDSPKTFLRREEVNQLEQHCLAAAEIYESLDISSLVTTIDFSLTLAKSHNFSVCSTTDFPLLWTSKYKTACVSLQFLQLSRFVWVFFEQLGRARKQVWNNWHCDHLHLDAVVWWSIAPSSHNHPNICSSCPPEPTMLLYSAAKAVHGAKNEPAKINKYQ